MPESLVGPTNDTGLTNSGTATATALRFRLHSVAARAEWR